MGYGWMYRTDGSIKHSDVCGVPYCNVSGSAVIANKECTKSSTEGILRVF